MATSYLAPGVYVEEVPSGARPIEAVGTQTAAFVGVAPDGGARVNEAVAINNWTEFLRNYVRPENTEHSPLAQAVYGFFLNGGGRCYVVNVGPGQAIVGDAKGRRGLDLLEAIDEVALVAAPGYTDPASQDSVISHCEKMRDRFAVLDAPMLSGNVQINLLTQVAQVGDTKKPKAGAGAGSGDAAVAADAPLAGPMRCRESNFAAYYAPWLRTRNALNATQVVETPPSGYILGIYARSDAERGVHKAPANEVVRGALRFEPAVNFGQQELLNPIGVNCLRALNGRGLRVWGARTISSDPEWKYLNVRRYFNYLGASIDRGTQWAVFEPNGELLWANVRGTISDFLYNEWRNGALLGSKPEEGFFVRCDRTTMTQNDLDNGRLICLIGVAVVKPAEFVIFRIGQKTADAKS